MAPGTDEAQRQRELTKQALAESAGKLEQRVRAELDWKARLRRDGPRYAAIAGGAVLLIGTIILVRSRLRRGKEEEAIAPTTLEDLAAELEKIRKEIKKGGDKTPSAEGRPSRCERGGCRRRRRGREAHHRSPGGYGRGRTAIVIRPMAQSAPSSLVISTSQIQVVRPR